MRNNEGYLLEYRAGTAWNEKSKAWYLECRGCGNMTKVGSEHLNSVLCHKCVNQSMNDLEKPKTVEYDND